MARSAVSLLRALPIEQWRNILDYPKYQVSTEGRVRLKVTRQQLKTTPNARGYLVVGLRNHEGRKLFYVHRLVAFAFLKEDPHRTQVNHKDTNVSNPSLYNLEWSTQPENVAHAQANGLGSQKQPVEVAETQERFASMYACARAFNVSDFAVMQAVKKGRPLYGFTIRPIFEGAPMPENNNVTLEDVELIFRNFAGQAGMYTREGDRNFAIKLNKEMADELSRTGWNVKTLKAREEDDEPQPYISVSVGYKGRPPTIVMITSRGRTQLDEDTVETLDMIDILKTDLIIRPYDWEVNGNTGRKAYLQSLYVTVNEDPLMLKYGNDSIATVDGPMMERTGTYIPEEI